MKKHLLINTLVSMAFIISDLFLTWCSDLADVYSLGAEMVLGMLIPFILVLFILFVIFSVSVSLYKAVSAKSIKQTIPILVFVAFAAIYSALLTPSGLWIRVLEYCK